MGEICWQAIFGGRKKKTDWAGREDSRSGEVVKLPQASVPLPARRPSSELTPEVKWDEPNPSGRKRPWNERS